MAKRYTVPHEGTWFGRVTWGMFAVLAISMAIAIPVVWLRDHDPAMARWFLALSPIFGFIALFLRHLIGASPSIIVDDVAGTLTAMTGEMKSRQRTHVRTYTFAQVGDLAIHEVEVDRDGPETWYELRSSGIQERLHFTRSRVLAERRARQLTEHLELHRLRGVLQRPMVHGGPNREAPDDLTEIQRVGSAEVETLLATLEQDRDPDVARRAKASRAQAVVARGRDGDD